MASPTIQALDNARATIMDYMHWNGTRYQTLTGAEWEVVYLAGNGFGDINLAFARANDWDWSHVRDSDTTGIVRMHDRLLQVLRNKLARMR